MKALGKLPRKKKAAMPRPSDTPEDGQEVEKLTDLDKLYLALADVKMESYFNTLCYSLNVTSLSALKDYSAKPDKKIMDSDDMDIIKEKIGTKDFDFGQLSQKYKRSNIVETCTMKGIPVIQKQDVTVTKSIVLSPYCGFVCEALWTKSVGVKEKVCLRYEQNEDLQFLHEAEMATLLRHKNILTLHGVIIASSYSPSVALVVEFAEIGNFHESSPNCSVEQLCRFTIQAATALEHLEKNKVIHRALEEYNFLVVAKDQMKLSGFGACQFESEIEKNPEESYMYTQKGVVSRFAYLFCNHFITRFRREEYNVELLSATNEGRNCPSHYCDVFDRCVLHNPELRPSFSEIRESLVAQKYPSKVRVVTSFTAESGEFISCNTGELITLISKDRHRVDKTAWLGETEDRKVGFFKSEYVEELLGYDIMDDSTVPPEIRARGPMAERAFQKAMQNGKVKVYRGRIMLLGQDRAGKTSLKKSLLGMPFNPDEESTIGVEVDPSKCEVDVDQVKNWEPTEGKKLEASEFVEDIARLIARDLNVSAAEQENISSTDSLSASEKKTSDEIDAGKLHSEASPSVLEPYQESKAAIDGPSNKLPKSSSQIQQEIQLNIDTTDLLPKDVADLVVQYLQNLKLEDDIKAKEVILTLWDFAGQHLYYASHSVFLSARAIYVLVYNLSKSLSAKAEPCVRQGIVDVVLDNPNNETNLDNFLSWLVSVHGIRLTDLNNEGANLKYRRPPVLIVGTHADQTFEDAKQMEKCIQENLLGKKYGEHVVTPFFAVDNTKSERDIGLQALREKIMEVLKQEPYMGEEVPLRWFKFEKVVETLVSLGTYYMDLDELLGYTKNVCQISDKQEFTTMLNFYHDLGVIVNYGRTVVLQAQWLIDLFKQLITVPHFEKLNTRYLECWRDLQKSGILRVALIDHVFTDFIQKGLHKQDILDMMERYGLIAKFPCLSPDNNQEQRYFVPSQLTSSPSGLCEIKPSQTDPCPLYLHFLDGFVPHGLFPQLLSRFMGWCSKRGPKVPQLYHNGGRFFIGVQTIFDLNLVCRKRFIKIVLKQRNPALGGQPSATSPETAVEVRTFLMSTLQDMSRDLSWLSNLRYELCVACPCCLQSSGQCRKHSSKCCSHEDCLHLLKVVPGEALICPNSLSEEIIQVNGLEKWFQPQKTEVNEEEMEVELSEGEASAAVDQALSLKGGTLSMDDLLLVAYELGTSWEILGRTLGLQPFELDHIKADERKLVEKCYGMLRKWTQVRGDLATYECLARALQDPTVGRSDLAAKYCEICRDTSVDSTAMVQPLSLKSGTPSSDDLQKVASELGASWKMFGRALNIKDPLLEQFEEHERELDSKCYGVLMRWSREFGSLATYECLARALQHPVVGRSDLAFKYCGICKDSSS